MFENQSPPILLEEKNNVFLIDWLTVVFHDVSVSFVQSLLGLNGPDIPWETEHAFRNGYPCRTSYKHINILWGADDERFYKSDSTRSAADKVRTDMGICLDLSGQGCREFENVPGNDWLKFLHDICDRDFKTNITRLDLAYDDHTGILDLNRIACDVRDRYYTSPSKKSQIIWSDDQVNDVKGLTVYIGSKSSDVMVRIYDKAAEREFGSELHWVRVELQLRHDRAQTAAGEIIKTHYLVVKKADNGDLITEEVYREPSVGRIAAGILRNYLIFRDPRTSDENKSRWPVASYWDKVLLDMERISLWISPGEPYNFSKTELHMIKQYGQALITIQEMNGSVGPLLDACRRTYPALSKKYANVIADINRTREEAREEKRYQERAMLTMDNNYMEWWFDADLLVDAEVF